MKILDVSFFVIVYFQSWRNFTIYVIYW